MKLMNQSRKVAGFSLVEMLVVLAIIAMIMGLMVPNLLGRKQSANIRAAVANIQLLDSNVVQFNLDTGKMPERLEDLVEKPAYAIGWMGPYVKKAALQDPWGNPFQYENPGQHGEFDVFTFGADNRQGGEGKNADHGNWD